MNEWQAEEQRVRMAIAGLREANTDRLLTIQKTLELANKAYFRYLAQKPAEQAKLLRMVLLNCAIDGVSVYPTYRKPFDMIFERAKDEEWSGERGFEPPTPWSRKGGGALRKPPPIPHPPLSSIPHYSALFQGSIRADNAF